MIEVAPGLRRWTARHPNWEPTDEPLRLCPERLLGEATHAHLRTKLRPRLDLPVQRVLVSHGAPVLRAGKRALSDALG